MKHLSKLLVFTLFLWANVFAQNDWFWQNPLPQGNTLRDIFVFDENTAIAVGSAGTVIKTNDGGENWSVQYETSEHLNSVHFVNTNTGWAVGEGGTILKTTDSGINWNSQHSGTSYPLIDVCFIDANTGWMVGGPWSGEQIILNTTDGGTNWIAQTSGVPNSLYSVFFINTNTGWSVGRSGTILKTTDGGANCYSQNSGCTDDLTSVYFINANTGWVVGCNGVILNTTDGGTGWNSQFYEDINFESVHFVSPEIGWIVGWTDKILKTTDGGKNWIFQNSITSLALKSVYFIDESTGWVAGVSGTILKTSGGSTAVEDNQPSNSVIPDHFVLFQNYPNPFNPATTIRYELAEESKISIVIYNVKGQQVKTLVNENSNAGSYNVNRNATDNFGISVTAGIYFYRITAEYKGEVFSATRRMVLLR